MSAVLPSWHRLSQDEAVQALQSDATRGLDSDEAARRLLRYGENRLLDAAKRPVWL